MSIKSAYVTRGEMLRVSENCFARDEDGLDKLISDDIINYVFDARLNYSEIPFIVIESEFRARGEHKLINNIVEYVDPSEPI